MKKQGKVTSWKEDQGFGFIRPDDGDKDIFLHVRNVVSRRGRPVVGRHVRYLESRDGQGRRCAVQAELAPEYGAVLEAACYVVLFFLALGAVIFAGVLPISFFWIYLLLSMAACFLYAQDKQAAIHGRWRVQEKTLHLVSLLGGWPGALLARQLFRHKSSKREFRLVFWATVVVNVLFLGYLVSGDGEYWARLIDAMLMVAVEALVTLLPL